MGDTEKRTDALTPTGGDWAHTIAKGALSAIPAVGGPAAELLAAIIVPPLARRRDEWIRALADGLHVLEARVEGFTIAGLAENEAFVSTVMQATTVAVRTHQQEKREALRNAVLNVAAGRAPDEDRQGMFLSWEDTFTAWHLRLLRVFQDPRLAVGNRADDIGMGSLGHLIERLFPELRREPAFYDQVWRDLYTRGLTNTDSLHATMTGNGLVSKRTTELGDVFLSFIAVPPEATR